MDLVVFFTDSGKVLSTIQCFIISVKGKHYSRYLFSILFSDHTRSLQIVQNLFNLENLKFGLFGLYDVVKMFSAVWVHRELNSENGIDRL